MFSSLSSTPTTISSPHLLHPTPSSSTASPSSPPAKSNMSSPIPIQKSGGFDYGEHEKKKYVVTPVATDVTVAAPKYRR